MGYTMRHRILRPQVCGRLPVQLLPETDVNLAYPRVFRPTLRHSSGHLYCLCKVKIYGNRSGCQAPISVRSICGGSVAVKRYEVKLKRVSG